jgi:hypothetical protein
MTLLSANSRLFNIHLRKTDRMQFLVGTSGYSYKESKGGFYPKKVAG